MSYISAVHSASTNQVLVWERTDSKERTLKKYKAPYYFYTSDENGKSTTIYGDKVTKVELKTSAEFKNRRYKAADKAEKTWEIDIPPELRVLSNDYYNVPAPKLNVTFYDIEVDYDPDIGFAGIDNPYAPINSVALYHSWSNTFLVICVPPDDNWSVDKLTKECNKDVPLPTDTTLKIILCKDERELLIHFLDIIDNSDVICGWNSNFFDTPYVGKRLQAVLGEKSLELLDFPDAGTPTYEDVLNRMTQKKIGTNLKLHGRIAADYLMLYKKYEPSERASYKLSAIEQEVDLNLPKLEYSGSLSDLYKNDFAFFIRYNLRDCEILRGFEQKLAYVELANQMYHLSCGLFPHVTGSLKLHELAIINYCHHELDRVVNNFTKSDIDRQIEGALVMEPKIGMHHWVGSIDINSLYPSAIRAINISPETLRGQFTTDVSAADAIAKSTADLVELQLENGDRITKTAYDWRTWLINKKWCVSGYGTVFDQTAPGIIPSILADWYATRKKYQALKKTAMADGDDEKADYFDRLQYVYKIKLNSLYGTLTNLYFRFYDLRMGESTTGTGRAILRHQISKVNEILSGDYTLIGDPVIYGDTDSAYFNTYASSVDEAVLIADAVADKVNESFQPYMKEAFLCAPGFDDIIKAGREIVSDSGIFVEKKRYILHIVDLEGKRVDKLKVMGLDTKKTSLPKVVSIMLNGFIERLLKGESWEVISESIVEYKEKLRNSPIFEIGLPKGIQEIDHFYNKVDFDKIVKINSSGNMLVSGHVAAALHYNKSLLDYNDKVSMPIKNGMKIKVYYLVGDFEPYKLFDKAPIKFKSIALPTDIEIVPQWFLDNFKVDIDAHIERLVDNPLENILKAIGKTSPTKQDLLIGSLLEF